MLFSFFMFSFSLKAHFIGNLMVHVKSMTTRVIAQMVRRCGLKGPRFESCLRSVREIVSIYWACFGFGMVARWHTIRHGCQINTLRLSAINVLNCRYEFYHKYTIVLLCSTTLSHFHHILSFYTFNKAHLV